MKNFYLFLSAIAVTFGFIAALQFISFPWFFAALLAMHCGVFLFIFSKKRFQKAGYDVKRFYSLEYKLLALYLPILGLKVLSAFEILYFDPTLKAVLILAVTAFSLVVSGYNAKKLYHYLQK